jgi:uncharacterized protein with von Willebrand factor type A (vWA) domain
LFIPDRTGVCPGRGINNCGGVVNMVTYRYSKWDGSQPFDLDSEKLMDELGKQIFKHGNLSRALRDLQRRGLPCQNRQMPSLERMAERLRRMKLEQLDRYNLDSVLDEIKQKLEKILDMERQGIQKKLDEARDKSQSADNALDPETRQRLLKQVEDMAAKNKEKLDELPPDAGGRIKELNNYDFMDESARKEFQELMDMLKKHAMEQMGKNLMQSLKNMGPNSLANMRDMVNALNQMMEQKMKGGMPDFNGFMERFGNFFGNNPPQNFEELMENLQEQMAQAQALMDSLSPETRKELQELLDSMLDDATKNELARMADNMARLLPSERMPKRYPFSGQDSISYDEAMKLMETLQKMDSLEQQIKGAQYDPSLESIDDELLEEIMGEDAKRELEALKEITRLLEEKGYIQKVGDRYELTPKAIRRIGQKALDNIFSQLKKDRAGSHNNKRLGAGSERIEDTKKYEYGDDFALHIQKTIMNSLVRKAAVPVELEVKDFEVLRTEELTRSAIVIILDQSLSMFLNGYFESAKKVAVAMDTLIKTRYPKDVLHVVTFSRRARKISGKDLLLTSAFQREQGTNYQNALRLARKLLANQSCNNKEIILISDGEPTAHSERDEVYFQYPPSLRTLQLTMREVKACTAQRIVINTFMFDNSPFIIGFVNQMARINKGRIFFTDPDNLGKYILQDYLSNKNQAIG